MVPISSALIRLCFVGTTTAVGIASLAGTINVRTGALNSTQPLQTPCINPGYLVAVQEHPDDPQIDSAPALVRLIVGNDRDRDEVQTLATVGQVGTIHGLAYDPDRQLVYAGAYFKYGASTGVGGGHAVYAVPAEGGARVLTQLPGTDRDPNPIMGGYRYVGITGAGDVETMLAPTRCSSPTCPISTSIGSQRVTDQSYPVVT